jgi:NitT/TauT family transport system substrate-binding protein
MFAPYFIAEEEGYFAEQGIQMEWVSDMNSAQATPLLAEGKIDVITAYGISFVNAILRGSDIRAVADMSSVPTAGCSANGIMARRDLVEAGELDGPEKLKGRRIAWQSASQEEYHLEAVLQTAGLALDDVEQVTIPLPAEMDALADGSLDLTVTGEPWMTWMQQAGTGIIWMPLHEIHPGFQSVTMLFGPSLLDNNPEAAERFMVAYLKAVRQYNEGKTKRNLEILAEHTGLEQELLAEACWPYFGDDGQINIQSLLGFQEWAAENGYLDAQISEDQLWDPTFIEYANEVLDTPSQ